MKYGLSVEDWDLIEILKKTPKSMGDLYDMGYDWKFVKSFLLRCEHSNIPVYQSDGECKKVVFGILTV